MHTPNHAHLGLKLLMVERPGKSFKVTDPGDVSPWLHADEVIEGERWAIWKATGHVYRVQHEGEPYPEAVTDDPVYEVPGGWRTNEAMQYDGGGLWAIQQERVRQVEEENWTGEHDDTHIYGELARAAACYAAPIKILGAQGLPPYLSYFDLWPFGGRADKRMGRSPDVGHAALTLPSNGEAVGRRIGELAKAGALIAAEIDRLARHGERFEYDHAPE